MSSRGQEEAPPLGIAVAADRLTLPRPWIDAVAMIDAFVVCVIISAITVGVASITLDGPGSTEELGSRMSVTVGGSHSIGFECQSFFSTFGTFPQK